MKPKIPAKAQKALRETRAQRRRRLVARGLEAWSVIVRRRDDYACQVCGRQSDTNHAHHIVARSLCGTLGALHEDNGVCLCWYHHMQWLKAEPDAYIAWRDSWLAARDLDYVALRRRMSARSHISTEDLCVVVQEMERRAKEKRTPR